MKGRFIGKNEAKNIKRKQEQLKNEPQLKSANSFDFPEEKYEGRNEDTENHIEIG